MKILAAGPVQGDYTSLLKKANQAGAHWVVSVGDFGIYPDPARIDRGARPFTSNEFAKRYVGALPSPITVPILTIAGVHDDNRWLNHRQAVNNAEVLNNVHWLAQGFKTIIGFEVPLRVTGLGRAYSEATYNGQPGKKFHRHYTRRDIERACSSGPTDLLLLYENLDCPGIRNVVFATRPKLIVTRKFNNGANYPFIQGIPVLALDRQETQLVEWSNSSFVL